MKIALEIPADRRHGISWASCSPFIENRKAVLTHRPRYVTTHKIGAQWKSHISIGCWCGNSFSGTKKFTFLDAPKTDALLCARCECAAVKAGLPSSSEIVGRHVHIGRVVAQQLCCLEKTP